MKGVESNVDFDFWVIQDGWTLKQAICLTLGINPRINLEASLPPEEFHTIEETFLTSCEAGVFNNSKNDSVLINDLKVSPCTYVERHKYIKSRENPITGKVIPGSQAQIIRKECNQYVNISPQHWINWVQSKGFRVNDNLIKAFSMYNTQYSTCNCNQTKAATEARRKNISDDWEGYVKEAAILASYIIQEGKKNLTNNDFAKIKEKLKLKMSIRALKAFKKGMPSEYIKTSGAPKTRIT